MHRCGHGDGVPRDVRIQRVGKDEMTGCNARRRIYVARQSRAGNEDLI